MSVLETIKHYLEASLTPSPAAISIGLAFVLLFPILLHFVYSAATPYTSLPSVLLIGPSGAGKTALLTLFERGPLLDQEKPPVSSPVAQTHTSQVPSSVELAVSTDNDTSTLTSYRVDLDAAGATAKRFLLVDTPGHPKLRGSTIARLASATPTINLTPTNTTSSSSSNGNTEPTKSKLKALIFLLDAASLADSDSDALATTASYLYDVLLTLQKRFHNSRSGSRAPSSVPVLIAANKLDLFTALPAALVKSQLEAELGRIRKTRSKGLLDSGVGADEDGGDVVGAAAGEEGEWLGDHGSDKFRFEQMMEFDVEVEVIGGNVVGDGPGAEKWWKWIGERV